MQDHPKRARSIEKGATKVQPCTSPSEGNAVEVETRLRLPEYTPSDDAGPARLKAVL